MSSSLYTSVGYSTKKMKKVQTEKTPFQYLWDYTPKEVPIDENFSKETIEATKAVIAPFKKKVVYFLAGELKNEQRSNENLLQKDMIVIDYDSIDMMYSVFLGQLRDRLQGVKFILYPSISNYVGQMGLRFRLIIETSRPYNRNENDNLLQNVMDYIGIPADNASKTWGQLMGMPTLNKLSPASLITKQEGEPLNVEKFLFEPKTKKEYVPSVTFTGELNHESAVAMVTAYTQRVGNKLLDRDYFIKYPYMNIKHNFEVGAIDWETVQDCLTILAMDNEDWAINNIEHFKHDTSQVKNGTPFAEFFGWALGTTPEKDFELNQISFKLIQQLKTDLLEIYDTAEETDAATYKECLKVIRTYRPKNHYELFTILEIEGILKRQMLKEVKKGPKNEFIVKRSRIKPRSIANILKVHCQFYRLIVQSEEDSYPFIIYDMETGLYKQSFDFLKRLILKIDYEKLEHECKQVKHFLSTECKMMPKTKDENLIVCKNGVFNRTTRKLEPFSPNYVFLTGINTKYVENAPEPKYKDGWSIETWIKQLSGDDRTKELNFWRCIFHANNPNIEHGKSVFFYSEEGRTGKGTFKDLIVNMVGEQNHASANLKRFDTRWVNAEIYGKTFVSGDENDDVKFLDGENFKTAVSNDYNSIEQKNEKTFTDKLGVFILQLMNERPNFNKFNSAEKRRILLVEFKNQSYTGSQNNPNVKNKYVKDAKLHEYILFRVLNMDNVGFEDTEESKNLIFQMELKRKPVKRYWLDYKDKFVSLRIPISFLYNHGFTSYMRAEGVKDTYIIALNTFIEELKKEIGDEWEYTSQKKPGNYFKHEDFSMFEDIEHYPFVWDETQKGKNQRLIERKE
ncbi:phage/plasmid primase, P4 family [Enterococcus sp. LJL120]